jgi:hypothetical protein
MRCGELAKNGHPCTRADRHTGKHSNEYCTQCGKGFKYHTDKSRCLSCLLLRNRKWRKKNPDKKRQSDANWAKNNLDRRRKIGSRWARNNRPKINRYYRHRWKNDLVFRLAGLIRNRFLCALKGRKKASSVLKLVGCSLEDLKLHLERQFQAGMTWENRGEWHIDHIKPCAKFDLSDPEQQHICFHYTNLQPLWAADNIRKSDTVFDFGIYR